MYHDPWYRGCWEQCQYLHCKLPVFVISEVAFCLILESVALCGGKNMYINLRYMWDSCFSNASGTDHCKLLTFMCPYVNIHIWLFFLWFLFFFFKNILLNTGQMQLIKVFALSLLFQPCHHFIVFSSSLCSVLVPVLCRNHHCCFLSHWLQVVFLFFHRSYYILFSKMLHDF
jgi:hypothetical protein